MPVLQAAPRLTHSLIMFSSVDPVVTKHTNTLNGASFRTLLLVAAQSLPGTSPAQITPSGQHRTLKDVPY